MTDYLQFVTVTTKTYSGILPILSAALERTDARQVVDLCSGAGGPWRGLQAALAVQGRKVSVSLTDMYPNAGAAADLHPERQNDIRYYSRPVDATRVPQELAGFRTLFSAFHHFSPSEARAVLADAVQARQGVAVVEGTQRSALALVLMLLVPLMVLLMTPLIRPFRWSRLLCTYALPIIPLACLHDGVVSCLRTYSVEELRELVQSLGSSDYHWEIGEVKSTIGPIPITYLTGCPLLTAEQCSSLNKFPG
jgi:hypothetical protein